MKLSSWNVNGIRAVLKKGALQDFLAEEAPDILCLQETKAKRNQVEVDLPDYTEYWNSASRAGYSGTAIFVKNAPTSTSEPTPQPTGAPAKPAAPKPAPLTVLSETHNLPPELTEKYHLSSPDQFGTPADEGRVLTLEFENFYLVTVYTPNSKRALERLPLRLTSWDPAFLAYLKTLETKKPVVTCGDFNAAHTEIDLARPKDNTHNAGFTPEERQGITNLLAAGFTDTFRSLNPDARRYTWWSHFGHARERNVGWRIDYFFISSTLKPSLKSANIHEEYLGSDHCPISIELNIPR